MTAAELREKLYSDILSIEKPLDSPVEVDAETYANVCQSIFDWMRSKESPYEFNSFHIPLSIGPNNGIMFKGIELINKDYKK